MSGLDNFVLPDRGFVFWPVGTGDSTTVVVDAERHMQIDIRQMSQSEEADDPHAAVVDVLARTLPMRNRKPYLSVFVLTHPDQDHCEGFRYLLEKVTIGELWFAPRVLSESEKELCDDAQAFKDEAERRIDQAKRGNRDSGERVRIIGYSDVLEEDEYQGFPSDLLTSPGSIVTEFDGDDIGSLFRAFIHAPFDKDADAERNETSVGMQLTLYENGAMCRALLLGDVSNPTVNHIFEFGHQDDLAWDVFLAPHHCSKSVMYVEEDGVESLDQDLMTKIESAANGCRYIISSSEPVPTSNAKGDNPPHVIAKNRYEEIVDDGHFLCTQESPSEQDPSPIVISLTDAGCDAEVDTAPSDDRATSVAAAVTSARGANSPPIQHVGFGKQ